jgi:hypothetical protein
VRLDARVLRGFLEGLRHRPDHVGRPTRARGRTAAIGHDLVVRADDGGGDLGAAEVDPSDQGGGPGFGLELVLRRGRNRTRRGLER